MTVLALISDLMMGSQVSAAATRVGAKLEIAATSAALLAAAEARSHGLLILDLSHPGLDPQELVPRLKALDPAASILAFGPHVHKERLAAAVAAGCDEVISRGQFHAQVDAILKGAAI